MLHSSKDHLINMYLLEASKKRLETSKSKGRIGIVENTIGNKLRY